MKTMKSALLGVALILLVPPRRAPASPGVSAAIRDEFFVVSSIDVGKRRLVLKRPSEVTVVVLVNDRTTYRAEDGRPLTLSDLRAGDTLYIVLGSDAGVEKTAVSIRRGPMTVEELQRRYLSR
jgi:hypothetical protein